MPVHKKQNFRSTQEPDISLQPENSIENKEELYRLIFENISDLVLITEVEGKFVFVSANVFHILGYTKEEIEGMGNITKFMGELTFSSEELEERKVLKIEKDIIDKSGQRLTFLVTIKHISKDGTKLIYTLHNITEQKEVEESLKLKESELELTLEAATDGIWTWNFKTGELTFSARYYKMLGYEPNEFPASFENWQGLIHPDDLEITMKTAKSWLKEKKGKYENEFRLKTKDDEYRWIRAQGRVVEHDENGEAVRMIGYHEDITGYKSVEQALRESQIRLQQAQELAQVGHWDWYLKSNKLIWSEEVFRIFGLDQKEFQPTIEAFEATIHPDDLENYTARRNQALSGEIEGGLEHRIVWPDGTIRYVFEMAEIHRNDAGEIIRLTGIIQDITSRKQNEIKLSDALGKARRREKEMSALLKASRVVHEDYTFEKMSRQIFDICSEIIEAKSGYVALLSEDGQENELLFLESGGLPCDVDPELPMPIRGLRNESYKSGEVVFDNNFSKSKWMKFMPEGHVKLDNVLFAPLKIDKKTVGLLGLANKKGGFSKNDAVLSCAFAEFAAIALERFRNAEALNESEQKFFQIAKNIREVFWMTEPLSEKVLYVSPGFEEIWQLPTEDLYKNPKKWIESIVKEDIKEVEANFYKQSQGTPTYEEFRISRPDGSIRWISNRSYPIIGDNGQVFRVTGIAEDITHRKQTENLIKASLREKEVLLRELYHRTKNTMQVISSMLILQSAKTSNSEVKKLVDNTVNRIRAMSLVHQKLYQSQDLSRISARDYIEELTGLLIKSYNFSPRIIIPILEVEDIPLLIDTVIPCGLILNELISNALKHGFPKRKKGEIHIKLFQKDFEHIIIEVSDNGIGVPADFDFRNQDTLGLKTIFAIVEHQMQGTVKFESKQGVTCHIEFSNTLYKQRI